MQDHGSFHPGGAGSRTCRERRLRDGLVPSRCREAGLSGAGDHKGRPYEFLRNSMGCGFVPWEDQGGSVTNPLIGRRIKAIRQARGISQDELARALGFKDRQIVSAIETGVRRVGAEELLLAMEHFDVPLEYFTDPYRLDGEGLFSWRQMGVPREQLMEYEGIAGRWIGGYLAMASQVGRKPRLMRQALGLTKLSSFKEATDAGERFAAEFDLGPVPGLRLAEVMEDRLGILVLLVDAYEGISAAACRLPDLDAVLIARGGEGPPQLRSGA